MRLAAYVDAAYYRDGNTTSTPESFPLFVAEMGKWFDSTVLLGRLHPEPGRSHHALPPEVGLVPLPWYGDLGRGTALVKAMAGTARAFWGGLRDVDVLFFPGPHPLAPVIVPIALARRCKIVLGVRQNTREYARHRYPDSKLPRILLGGLETLWQLLARRMPVAPVGPELAAVYAKAPRLYELGVSMVHDADLSGPEVLERRDYSTPTLLSVGRLETEKNPVMLADVLAELVRGGGSWKLAVVGEGPMDADLRARLDELGVAEHADLLGYVPVDGGLMDLYRDSHILLHTSWTEGLPQILFEAFAARLPVVASNVGGVPAAAGDAALLYEAGDVKAAAEHVRRIAGDGALRSRLTELGSERVASRTIESAARGLSLWIRDQT